MPYDNEVRHDPGLLGGDYGEVLWSPTEPTVEQARISAYRRWLISERGLTLPDDAATRGYRALWQWSVTEPGAFWDSLWDYFNVRGERAGSLVMSGGPMPDVTWFPGAALNYAGNALGTAQSEPDTPAVIAVDEEGQQATLTYGELAAEVARVRAGLRELGVGMGDRVAAFLPNVPEALIGLLAAASLGAVWSSCSPDFGAHSVIDRFAQVTPKVLLAVGGYRYGGKDFDRRAAVREIVAALPSVRAVIAVGGDIGEPERDVVAFASLGSGGHHSLEFADVSFSHPLWVLYSSGTTGLPKAIVHSHGGIVLEHLKSVSFHQDLGHGDVFLWYTTTGWMMWNYLAGGLLAGATVVLYNGSANHPDLGALWRLAGRTGVTFLGTSAPYLLACAKAGLSPGTEHDLAALRGVGSTGSPLPPEGFRWVYDHVGAGVQLGSFSGGTDVCTGFLGTSPLLPVRAGLLGGACLGVKVEAYDAAGKPVISEVGELVVTQAMPSMPVGFWNDPGGVRYRGSYFSTYPGIWRHGDWVTELPGGAFVVFGRSDATLNRGGVRMGTSEFYRVVEALPEVTDSLVVDTGQLGAEGQLILYLSLADGHELDDALRTRLKSALRSGLSPRHVPDEIRQVPGIPRTLSGKKLEVPVRKILLGTPAAEAADPDALANPEVLAWFAPTAPPRVES